MRKQTPGGSSELLTHSPRSNAEDDNDDLRDGEYPLRPLNNVDGLRTEPSHGALAESDEFENYDEEEGSYLIVPGQQPPRPPYQNHSFRSSDKAPSPSRSIYQAVARWIKGPEPPRIYRIQSSEWLQAACDRLLDKCCASRWLKLVLLLLIYALWIATFVFALPISADESNDAAGGKPVRLHCVSQLWYDYLATMANELSLTEAGRIARTVALMAKSASLSRTVASNSFAQLAVVMLKCSNPISSDLKRSTTGVSLSEDPKTLRTLPQQSIAETLSSVLLPCMLG